MTANQTGPADPHLASEGGAWFDRFETSDLPRLRATLVTTFGVELGAEAAAEAARYAWEHRDRLAEMASPVGYLFRVGQTAVRSQLRWRRAPQLVPVRSGSEDRIDPDLPTALARLSVRQRTAVVCVHAAGWTYEETAEAMGVDVSTVRTHVARGLTKLRALLEEDDR